MSRRIHHRFRYLWSMRQSCCVVGLPIVVPRLLSVLRDEKDVLGCCRFFGLAPRKSRFRAKLIRSARIPNLPVRGTARCTGEGKALWFR